MKDLGDDGKVILRAVHGVRFRTVKEGKCVVISNWVRAPSVPMHLGL